MQVLVFGKACRCRSEKSAPVKAENSCRRPGADQLCWGTGPGCSCVGSGPRARAGGGAIGQAAGHEQQRQQDSGCCRMCWRMTARTAVIALGWSRRCEGSGSLLGSCPLLDNTTVNIHVSIAEVSNGHRVNPSAYLNLEKLQRSNWLSPKPKAFTNTSQSTLSPAAAAYRSLPPFRWYHRQLLPEYQSQCGCILTLSPS